MDTASATPDVPMFVWPDPDNWARLLTLARKEAISLRFVARSRVVMHATSGSRPGINYIVGELGCSCPAGRNGKLCKHYCLYIFQHADRLVKKYGPPAWSIPSEGEEVAG